MNLRINKSYHLKFLEPFISVAFLILMIASPLLFGESEEGVNWEHIFRIWTSFLPYIALYLLNRFVFLPFFFFRGRRWLYFTSNIFLILALASLVHIYRPNAFQPRPPGNRSETLAPRGDVPPGERPPGPGERPPKQHPPFFTFIMVSVLIIGFDTGLIISVKWAQSEQLRIRAEKESVESQLAFLQNQVSPHFFMNTLNNIHSLIDIDTTEAKESIIKPSKLMRHLLYESQVERIPLKKEIEFIQNYVELMKLRFYEKVKITLHIPDQIPDKSIPPLLHTSFVENAFKHGISFSQESGQLSFVAKNSNPGMKNDEGPSGIGIANSRKRLDLIYGDSYNLDINDTKEAFTISLKIPV